MRLSGVGSVAFFWGTIFGLGGQKPYLTRILPSYSGGENQKKRTKVFFKNTPQWHRSYCFLLGHNFRLGVQKPSLIRILCSHSRVKTKNKTKRSLSQMNSDGVRPVAFFWGTILTRLGGHISRLGVTAPK